MRPHPEWLATGGVKAKVLVIDSGLRPEPSLAPVEVRNCCHGETAEDVLGHGTMVARIIASRNPLDLGYAPACDLYVAKVIGQSRQSNWEGLMQALQWAGDARMDVVNLSLAFENHQPDVQAILCWLTNGNILVCASHSRVLPYPHRYPGVISVGTPDSQGEPDVRTTGEVIKQTPTGPQPFRGPSAACAVFSGVAACARSYRPGIDRNELLEALRG